ncbi:VCBS domain-containing protein [Colwellia psychrerythraea]|uniref:VCBS repeat protein n=1 Tax=Colwellia psychrerythraea (strain 34H / ATCC BAA-681) TaxID=167879 RepID=Q481X2_COLP3|nr:VCBS domain-containing protein [Colwellia psychrerythraea]AAZ27956.1 VCBS repeat protein [Colwellia psychrerythraea 34H]
MTNDKDKSNPKDEVGKEEAKKARDLKLSQEKALKTDKDVERLKAKEFKSTSTYQGASNADLVADKSSILIAENQKNSGVEASPEEHTDDSDLLASNLEQSSLIDDTSKSLNENTSDSVTNQDETSEQTEGNAKTPQLTRIGKGGGVTTPEGATVHFSSEYNVGSQVGNENTASNNSINALKESANKIPPLNQTITPEALANATEQLTDKAKAGGSTQALSKEIPQIVAVQPPEQIQQKVPEPLRQEIPLSAVITLNEITLDNTINKVESSALVQITGTVGGDVKDNDLVTLIIGNQVFNGVVVNGIFQIAVSGSSLLNEDKVIAELTVNNAEGHSLTVSTEQHYLVDTSIFAKDDQSTAVEDQGALATSGNVLGNDDQDSTHVTTTDFVGRFGIYHFKTDGSYTYELDNTKVQSFRAGEHHEDFAYYEIKDNAGNTTTAKLTTLIEGTNDRGIIFGTSTASLTEDKDVHSGQLRVDGALTVTDVDAGENQFSAENIQGQFGSLSINNLGHWTYTADNSQPTIQGLKTGESVTDTVLVHSLGGTQQKVTITIDGTDDKAVISGTSTAQLTEDQDVHAGQLRIDGALTVTDLDNGQAQFSAESLQGQFGSLSINNLGHWIYTADNSQPTIQGLKTGESVTDTVLVHSVDGTSQQISVTINGTDDKAVIAGTSTASLTEDKDVQSGLLRVDGALTVTDEDNGQAQFSAESLQGQFGTLSINNLGHWTYTADNSQPTIQGLKTGESVTDKVLVHSIDGTEQQVTVTINGTDDTAIIGGTSTASVTEDINANAVNTLKGHTAIHHGIATHGQLTVSDFDKGESHFVGQQTDQAHGTFILNENGFWNYTVDNSSSAVQSIGLGQSITDTISVSSADGTTHDIVVTIQGTNDAPKVSAEVILQTGTEDTNIILTQTQLLANSSDIDSNDLNQLQVDSITSNHGVVTTNADGSFTFHPDQDYNGQVHFTYDVKDSHGGLTHTGATTSLTAIQDNAVITGQDSGDVKEDINVGPVVAGNANMIETHGQMHISDPDAGENHFHVKNYGFINDAGHPELHPIVSALGGYLSIGSDGTWFYRIDTRKSVIQNLGEGESTTDTVTVTSIDGTSHVVTVTIHGTNDAPFCSSEVQLSPGSEDTVINLSSAQLLANASDIDANDLGQLSVENLTADHGSIVDNKDGTFSFNPDQDYNGQVHFTYDVKDTHGGITRTGASTTLQAINDNPDVKPITDSLTEGTEQQHQVNLLGNATDVEGDTLSISQVQITFEGRTGPLPKGVSFASDGHTLVVDSQNPTFQHLSEGQKADIVVNYMVDDNHGGQTPAVATLTMIGTDDKATLVSSHIDMTEGEALHTYYQLGSKVRGTLNLVDADTNDHTQFTFSSNQGTQGYGALTIWPDGHYEYDLDMARNHHSNYRIDALKAGETLTDQHEVKTSDGQTKLITVTIHGENDNARIEVSMPQALPASQNVTEEHFVPASQTHLYAGGMLRVVDPDHGDAELQPETITTAHHGEFSINANGSWSYKIDNAIDSVQQLGAGESFTETHTVHSKDGTASQLLTVTVHGTNDAPKVSAAVHLAPSTEDTDIQLSSVELLANATDIDHNDVGQLSIANLVADHGVIIDNKDGTFSFSPEKDYNGEVFFSYDVTDAHGGATQALATTSLTAVQDNAIISGVDTGSVTENTAGKDMSPDQALAGMGHLTGAMLYADGKLNISDPDTGENEFDTNQGGGHGYGYTYHGTYGQLVLNADGGWHYNVNAGNRHNGAMPGTVGTAIDKLGDGDSLTDTITVRAKDGTEHDIFITIHGSNDRPYCSSEVSLQSGTEDIDQTFTLAQLLANTVDVDSNDAGQLRIDNLLVDHGSIVDNNDGTYTLTQEQDYNGEVHFTYDVKDAHGGVTHTGASTTLAAINDNPDVLPITDSVKEDASNHHTVDLLLGASDKEGDALSINQLSYSIDGSSSSSQLPAGLSLSTDGHTIIVDATNSAYQHLANGQSQTITIAYQVNDGQGGHTQQTANLTIEGTDDKATLVSNVIQLTETQALDSQFHIYKGNLQLIDPDSGDNTQFTFSGKYLGLGYEPGHFDVWPDGSYQFRLQGASNRHADDLISSLHAGESMEIPYEVKTNEGQKITIMVKVIGEDNQARIEVGRYSRFDNHAYEDNISPGSTPNQIYSGGNLYVIDPDHSQAGFIAQHITTSEGGSFFINPRGNWAYTIDNDKVQHLGAGESYQKTFTVDSIDGSAQKDITVTVHGTNDAPVVSAQVQIAHGSEDTNIQLNAIDLLANATDVDDNDAGKLNIANLVADHGTISDNNNGTYTFHPEQDYNGQVHFTYDVKDTHGGITHTGATTTLAAVRDSAVITEVNTGSIVEDGPNSSGNAGMVTELASGTLNVVDPDSGENSFQYSQFGETKVQDSFGGELRIDSGGNWGYHVDNASLQQLAEGQTEEVIYRVHSRDGTPYDLHINVIGTNDAPTVNHVNLSNGSEDVNYQMQANQFGFTDVDSGDTLHSITLTNLPSATAGIFVLDGHDVSENQVITTSDISKLQFVPTNDFNGDLNFSYTVNDGHTDSQEATNTLHINPVNDVATMDGQSQSNISAEITEDSTNNVISGHLTLIDPDAGEDKFAANTQISGQYGQLTLDENGSWHYALNNASSTVNALEAGQQLTDTLTVISPDGSASETIAITIQGHSDTPSLQLQEAGAVQGLNLFAGIQGNGISQLQYSTDGVNFSSQIPPGFNLAADGHTLEVDPANVAYDHLANGVQHKVLVNYQLQEGTGSSAHQSSQQAQVVITGTSDRPAIQSFSANSDQFSGPVTGNLLQGATDVDDGAKLILQDLQFKDPSSHHYVTVHAGQDVSITGVGHIAIAPNGDYTFIPDPSFNGDTPGFIYRIVDVHGDYHDNSQSNLNIHINVNHQPTVQTLTTSTNEDTDLQFSAASFDYQDSDSDALDHLTITKIPDASSGVLLLNGHVVTQGQAITANNIDKLIFKPALNFNGDAHFSYVANDGHQDSISHTALLSVTAVNDLPTLTINQTNHIQGNLVATDVDIGDSLSFSAPQTTGSFGHLSIDPDSGTYTYTQHNSVAHMNYNSATSTYTGVDIFEVQVSDNHGGVARKYISFSAQATVSSTTAGNLVIRSSVPHQPVVTNSLPAGHTVINTPTSNHVSIDLSSASDSGSANNDDLTNDTTPTITGHTDIPFSKVSIYDGNTPVGHALSNASGDFSVTVSNLVEGLHSLSAKALGPSSILPAVSSVLDVQIDTQASVTIQIDPITSDNVINAQESGTDISVTGQVSGDVHQGDIISLVVGQHSYAATVDHSGHFSVNIAGAELASDSSITASVVTIDNAGNTANATQVMHYDTDTKVGMPTITFESAGSDNAYSKAEIAQGHAGTVTATVHASADAKVGEHLSVNGVDHVLDANSLAHGIALEVAPSGIVKAIMTDEYGNSNSALNMAANAKPEPIVVTAPPGSHHIGASLGIPTLMPTQTPVPVAEQGWKILVNGHYETSYSSQWGTLSINPKTGQLNYQEHANTHSGPHGSASTVGVHEDRFEVALQGSHHDDVIMHVQVNILSRGPGHSGKLTLGSEVLDMTVTPTFNHPAPPSQVVDAHDEPQSDFIADVSLDLDAIVVADNVDSDVTANKDHEEPSTVSATEQAQADPVAILPVSEAPVAVSIAVTSSPIDHYLQMIGISPQDIAPKDGAPTMSNLPDMQVLSSNEADADMVDTNQVDAFDSPLDDDKHHHDLAVLDDDLNEQSLNEPLIDHDDDSLHQALNDMHSQF